MRILFFVAFLLLAGSASSQDQVALVWTFQPNRVYTTSTTTTMDMSMDISGNPTKVNDVKSKGGAFPMKVSGLSDIKLTTTTGKQAPDKSVPLKIVYDKMWTMQKVGDTEKGENNPLTGLAMQGTFTRENKIKIDTIISENVNAEVRAALRATIESALIMIKFPNKPFKVGDTFDQNIPMSIPVPGMPPIEMQINTNYKLREISKSLAKFDIVQKVTLNLEKAPIKISVEGQGNGTADFDFSVGTMVDYAAKLDFTMNMFIEDLILTAVASSNVKQNVVVK